jgi:hypothetical protein
MELGYWLVGRMSVKSCILSINYKYNYLGGLLVHHNGSVPSSSVLFRQFDYAIKPMTYRLSCNDCD